MRQQSRLDQQRPRDALQHLRELLQKHYAGLSPMLRKAARVALENPDDVALLSMRQFAKSAGFQPSTMVRLATELGMSGYGEFRRPFEARLRNRSTSTFTGLGRDVQSRSATAAEALFGEALTLDRQSIAEITETTGYDSLQAAARVISQADQVLVCGVRSCYPAAFFFSYACAMFADNIALVDGGGGTLADSLKSLNGNSVLVVLSFPPYSRFVVQASRYAVSNQARVVAITDSEISPLIADERTIPLLVRTASPSFFHSLAPVMSVLQVLVMMILAHSGDHAIAALEQRERHLRAFGTYWSDDDWETEHFQP